MTELTKRLAIALTLGLAAPAAFAQDTPATDGAATTPPAAEAPAAAAPATPAQTPAPAADKQPDGPGTTYIAKTFDDWALQCVHTEDGNDPCQMYQLLKDEKGNNVADISMVALTGSAKAVAGATIMTPLETLLTQGVTLKIDTNEARSYPFTFCAPVGCFARVGLTAEELAAFKKGNKVSMTVVPVAAPDHPVTVAISLKGFTAAYDAVTKVSAQTSTSPAPAPKQ
ncbi:invasion associated locus B family protein [Paenirhodobacter hankyongi]|uniref:Invasion associated locus B family protein n=1 Tax=Paenirhodobacter hankyongi TaxID=2294033 RepID=A0A421BRN0_9RHOB|nr:invasion associated locus B family protein [Sinirhodobacter hankyongi]RLL70930.1 invasion associated locus B family protein [Sinirhodobacter hankyongi]